MLARTLFLLAHIFLASKSFIEIKLEEENPQWPWHEHLKDVSVQPDFCPV